MAFLAIFVFTEMLAAQTDPEASSPGVLRACEGDVNEIVAAKIPRDSEDGPGKRDVSLEGCPVADRTIVDGGVGAVLPAPGQAVYAEALTTDGAEELVVERSEDGDVLELTDVGAETGSPAQLDGGASAEPGGSGGVTARAAPGACSDNYYNPYGGKWFETFRYSINLNNLPLNDIGFDAAIGAIRRGGSNITTTNTNCNFGDVISAGIAYEGTEFRSPNISASAVCGDYDDYNVVGFGDLPNSSSRTTLAVACRWYIGNTYVASDQRYNATDANFTANPTGSSCSNKYGLEGIATHEFGHTFGLGHADPEVDHEWLTMSPMINGTCQASEETLGQGDVLGLGSLY